MEPSTPAPLDAAGLPMTVLVVDDDQANLRSVQRILEKEGFRVLAAKDGHAALQTARQHVVHVMLTDLMMPGMTGISLMKAMAAVVPDLEVVMMTAHGTIESAVEAMRSGAYDFVEKPLRRISIVRTVRKAAEKRRLVAENQTLKRALMALKQRPAIGISPRWRQALETATQAAPSTATVLILGESGTGKELLARHIHERSGRKGPFVGVNLSALPESIVEAELFGHEKGAFTGAVHKREGRIAQASEGTLFLDEIGELQPSVQVKLLRVLQEGEYEPLGGQTQQANFRLVAATNRDLHEAVELGHFRADLFYRLNVIAIRCPLLRERREDIPLLVDHFLQTYAARNGKPPLLVSPEAMAKLSAYAWPGNVRELENAMERSVVLAKQNIIDVEDLPQPISEAPSQGMTLSFAIGTSLDHVERTLIEATLRHTDGDKQHAAQLLGISARTIYRKLAGLDGDLDG